MCTPPPLQYIRSTFRKSVFVHKAIVIPVDARIRRKRGELLTPAVLPAANVYRGKY